MKSKKVGIIIILLGIAIVAYPIISNIIERKNQTVAISNYENEVEKLSEQEIENKKEEAKRYNESLSRRRRNKYPTK